MSPNNVVMLYCKHCGWKGTYENLKPLGSVGRLHCPDCYSEYGTYDGVPAPDQVKQGHDSQFFRRKSSQQVPIQLTADAEWITVRVWIDGEWIPVIGAKNTTCSGGTVDLTAYALETVEAEKHG